MASRGRAHNARETWITPSVLRGAYVPALSMAGTPKKRAKAVATAPVTNQRTRRTRARKSAAYKDLMVRASEQGVTRKAGQTAADVLQEVLDRAVGGMRYAASEVDKLTPEKFWVTKTDAQGNVLTEPNKWYQLEQACRAEVQSLAGLMSELGIAERAVRVEEAKAALMIAAVRDAAREAGLNAGQVRALGSALRSRLEALDEQAVAA